MKAKIDLEKYIAWLEKQIPIDKEKVLIGARKDVALSIMKFLDRNTLGMCLSNLECKDLVEAVVDSDWSKVYDYMKKKLEKQGKQKSADKIEPKFKVGDAIKITGINNGHTGFSILNLEDGYYYNWKLVEYKPAWSEEDEKIITGIINDIQKRLEDYPLEQLAEIYFKEIKWLKSLRKRIEGE